MKLSKTYAALLVTSFSAIGLAEISLDPLPLRLYSGDSCELHWTTDRDYALELLLVQRFDEDGLSGWSPVETIFDNQLISAGSGSYNWTIPDVEEHDVSYSLWLSGSSSPSGGYANITNRFHIESADDQDDHLASFGEIAGALAGFLACLMVFATATAALLRLMRQDARVERHCEEEELDRPYDFDTVMDEKAGLRLAMKEYIESNDERWD